MKIRLNPIPEKLLESAYQAAVLHGTPVFVYFPDRLYQRAKQLKHAVKIDSSIPTTVAYSYKTNFLPEVCSEIHKAGIGAEVVSHMEFILAHKLGVPAHKIVVNGPAKSIEFCNSIVEKGAGLVNIETETEFEILNNLAGMKNRRIPIGVRFDFNIDAHSSEGMKKNDHQAIGKFGRKWPDSATLEWLVDISRKHKYLNLEALSVNLGSMICTQAPYLTAINNLLEVIRTLIKHGIKIRLIDVGGGFAVSNLIRQGKSTHPQTGSPFELYDDRVNPCKLINQLSKMIKAESDYVTHMFAEPGRWLVSDSFLLIGKVIAVKNDTCLPWAYIDVGIDTFPDAGWGECRRIERCWPVNNSEKKEFALAGPLCLKGDVFNQRIELPSDLSVGDLIAIADAGAYSWSRASSFGIPRPPVILSRKKQLHQIRRRESFDEVFYSRSEKTETKTQRFCDQIIPQKIWADKSTIVSMFTGISDSILAALMTADQNVESNVHLFTIDGVGMRGASDGIAQRTAEELMVERANITGHTNIQGSYFFRELALNTGGQYVGSLGKASICTGCMASVILSGILICRKIRVNTMVTGMRHWPGELDDLIVDLPKKYEIDHITPCINMNPDQVVENIKRSGFKVDNLKCRCLFSKKKEPHKKNHPIKMQKLVESIKSKCLAWLGAVA